MSHTELTSREEYEAAIAKDDKYVLIFAYVDEVHPKAEERAQKHAGTTHNYKVDISKNESAAKGLGLTPADAPAVVIYKAGKEVKRFKNVNAEIAEEIGAFLGT
ncbi:uncharacterized protein PV09_07035 [Verruconis gallopava]|uniref:Thioredoxin domain-containing protein n=1 Tax=Verruconis gallopava TaxID=253628 RepID=A0A0D2AQW4_9PEZI|nr:uncharacterized protein PV09_07035 [Verruconis gallopava]KIW01559.1 hypothetical protein PV09_07035 [Verruconis gallopava]